MGIKLQLVDGWQKCYKWFSVQMAAALTLLLSTYEYIPMVDKYLPREYLKYIAIAVIIARLIKQKQPEGEKKE